jgi:hypothetical protein
MAPDRTTDRADRQRRVDVTKLGDDLLGAVPLPTPSTAHRETPSGAERPIVSHSTWTGLGEAGQQHPR